MKAVLFKNFSDEKFVCSWDKVPYTFSAGQEMYVEDWKAEHFAKHLIDRELHKKGLIISNKVLRDELLAKALPQEEIITAEEAFDLQTKAGVIGVTTDIHNDKVTEKKKAGRPKKVEKEEEFEGLTK